MQAGDRQRPAGLDLAGMFAASSVPFALSVTRPASGAFL